MADIQISKHTQKSNCFATYVEHIQSLAYQIPIHSLLSLLALESNKYELILAD